MARIYTICGKYDEAIGELDYLLSQETKFTVHDVELDETFASLRELPAYQVLMKKYAIAPAT